MSTPLQAFYAAVGASITPSALQQLTPGILTFTGTAFLASVFALLVVERIFKLANIQDMLQSVFNSQLGLALGTFIGFAVQNLLSKLL